MKTIQQLFFWCALLSLAAGCNCEEPDFLVTPESVQRVFQVAEVEHFENADQDVFIIQFNDAVDASSVIFQQTLFIEGGNDVPALFNGTYTFSWDRIFIQNCDLGCQQDECTLNLLLSGLASGNAGGVRSANGSLLDGDRDGVPGGDFRVDLLATSCP